MRGIRKLSQEFLECRMLGHSWEQFGTPQRKRSWGTTLTFYCTRCGMERDDTFDINGDLSMRAYIQPDGYRLTKDNTPRVQQLRLELLRRLR